MKKEFKNILIFTIFICIFFFVDAHFAYATDYYKTGTLVSENLLTGKTDVGAITQFSATATIGAGETVNVQFSRDKMIWYDSAGTAHASSTLANGANAIDISPLNWVGQVFYYKLIFYRNATTSTPQIDDVSVDYTTVAGPTYDYYMEGTLVSENLLTGLTNVGAITQFSATTAIATGETLKVQFSRDKITWYDNAGTAFAENTLANGSNNISLSALGWSGPVIYYKLHFTTSDPGITPTVTIVSVDYSAGVGADYYNFGTLVSTNLVSGGDVLNGKELFGYDISSLPSGTTVTVQFSTSTNDVWYGSNGTLYGSDTLLSGQHINDDTALNLSTLNLSGSSFYYKLSFTTNDNTKTPAVTKVQLFYPVNSAVKAPSTANERISSSPAVAGAPGWYSGGWSYRKKINVDPQKVGSTTASYLNDFPMLVSVIDPDLKYTASGGKVASSTAGDIIFTAGDGITALNYEIEKYTSTTGELVAWVKIPFMSSTSTTPIYMYLGNASAPNVSAATVTGVWDANYLGIYHLNEANGASALDSTTNGNNLTSTSYPTATTGGLFGTGQSFNGTTNFLSRTWTSPAGSMTISAWVNVSSYSANRDTPLAGFSGYPGLDLVTNTSSVIKAVVAANSYITGKTTITRGSWWYLTGVCDQANNKNHIYVNGVLDDSAPVTFTCGSYSPFIINNNGSTLNAVEDEVRVSGSARTADWILTEYRNQNSPSTFYSYSGLENYNGRVDSSGAVAPAVKVRGGVKFR